MENTNSPLKEEERNSKSYLREMKRIYKLTTKLGRSISLQTTTMIDPATGWIDTRTVWSAQADLVANQVELAWLTRYSSP